MRLVEELQNFILSFWDLGELSILFVSKYRLLIFVQYIHNLLKIVLLILDCLVCILHLLCIVQLVHLLLTLSEFDDALALTIDLLVDYVCIVG